MSKAVESLEAIARLIDEHRSACGPNDAALDEALRIASNAAWSAYTEAGGTHEAPMAPVETLDASYRPMTY